jgi:sec-independent protein translocase protein TatA
MNLGFQEILLIFFIIMLLFGAKKLPELARGMGKAVKEFRNSLNELEDVKKDVEKNLDFSNK